MKKNILTLIAMLSLATFMSAQDNVLSESSAEEHAAAVSVSHFGYLSYSEVMKAMPEYAEAIKSLDELKASYDEEMNRAEKEFSKKFAEYVDGQKSFPENIMLKRQKELQQLMEQSIKFKNEAQELLNKAEQELMAPIKERLAKALMEVGKANGYAYILNTDSNAYPYITDGGMAEDCTVKVLETLGVK